MKQIDITGNIADGDIQFFQVTDDKGINVVVDLESGSVQVDLKRRIRPGRVITAKSGTAAIAYTASEDETIFFKRDEIIGIGASGASSPVATVQLFGGLLPVVD